MEGQTTLHIVRWYWFAVQQLIIFIGGWNVCVFCWHRQTNGILYGRRSKVLLVTVVILVSRTSLLMMSEYFWIQNTTHVSLITENEMNSWDFNLIGYKEQLHYNLFSSLKELEVRGKEAQVPFNSQVFYCKVKNDSVLWSFRISRKILRHENMAFHYR